MPIQNTVTGALVYLPNAKGVSDQVMATRALEATPFRHGDSAQWRYISSDDVVTAAGESAKPTADDVRAEATRRMIAVVGARDKAHLDIIISNGTREAVRLLRAGATSWTTEETARADALALVDTIIEGIRTASNTLEATSPIPDDFKDNSYWP